MMNEIEQIEKYLNQQLSEEEVEKFKNKLDSDEAFRQEFEDYKKIFSGFKTLRHEKFEAKLREWDAAEPLDTSQENSTSSSGKIRWLGKIAAAASIVLVLGLGWWAMMDQSSPLQTFTESQSKLISMHTDGEKSGDLLEETRLILQNAQTDYANSNFAEGREKVKNIPADNSAYLEAQYLIGHASFKLGEYNQSIQAFENLLDHSDIETFKKREDASWTYLLALSQLYIQEPTEENARQLQSKLNEVMKDANPRNIYLKKEKELKKLVETLLD